MSLDNNRPLQELERVTNVQADPVFTTEVITALRVGLARIEGKLDAALTLRRDFEDYKKAVSVELEDHGTRLTKAEAWQGFAMWIVGAGQALVLVIVAAALAYYWHH